MWQIDIQSRKRNVGGPGSSLCVTRDAGASWRKLSGDLPEAAVTLVENRMEALIRDRSPSSTALLVLEYFVLGREGFSFRRRFGFDRSEGGPSPEPPE